MDFDVSATEADWSRENVTRFWDPGPKLIRALRRYQRARARGGPLGTLASKYWVLVHRFWSVITQSELHLHMEVGGGLRLPHPTGIVVHPNAVIGPNCMLMHQVTLSGAVRMGGHVDVGAGAKLLGEITIGDNVEIGANAVVTKDVPDGAVVAGIPARVIRMKDNT
ncbi:serine O-acetyltransferase [Shimia sp. W99]